MSAEFPVPSVTTMAEPPSSTRLDSASEAPCSKRPMIFLRVKRPRSTDEASSSAGVVVRCADLALRREVAPDTSMGADCMSPNGAPQRVLRYTFTRVVKSATSVPSVAAPIPDPPQTPVAPPLCDGATAAAPGLSSTPHADALDSALQCLSIETAHHRQPLRLHGVKALPNSDDIAARQLQRHREQAVAARTSLRCERIGVCRGSNVLCIDASVVPTRGGGGVEEGEELRLGGGADVNECVYYDLYQLEAVDDEEDSDPHSGSGSSSPSEFGCDDGGAVEEDGDMLFDDAADEFSFDVVRKRHTQRDRRMRKTLRSARALELVNIPLRNDWVQYLDRDGLQVADSSLVLDDEFPEGVDNYMYYDHRHDDEYDSNAEDRPANEYPEESDSTGDEDQSDDCGGYGDDDDDNDNTRRYIGHNEEDDDG